MRFRILYYAAILMFISCEPNNGNEKKSVKKDIDTLVTDTSHTEIKPKEIPKFDPEKYVVWADSLVKGNLVVTSNYGWFEEEKIVRKLTGSQNDGDEIFSISKGTDGFILMVSCSPQSQSGDWFEYERYVFDTLGRTIQHIFHHSTFVSDCGEARINCIRWFDENFSQVKEERKQSDFEESEIKNQNCFPRLEIKTAQNLTELSKRPGLQKAILKNK